MFHILREKYFYWRMNIEYVKNEVDFIYNLSSLYVLNYDGNFL